MKFILIFYIISYILCVLFLEMRVKTFVGERSATFGERFILGFFGAFMITLFVGLPICGIIYIIQSII